MIIIQRNINKIIFIACAFISLNAQGFSDSRSEKWAFFLAPQFTNSKVLQFDNGAEASINERSGLGFGFAYNMDRHIELGMLFTSSSANYTGTRVLDNGSGSTEKFSANLYVSSLNFDFTYNFLSTPFTPYISANIGSSFIDSGIPTGNIGTVCWWDPWWGYVCTPSAQTYTSTEMNYGVGLGLRYDFNRKVYIKGGVQQNRIDIGSSNMPDFTTYRFIFGFMF